MRHRGTGRALGRMLALAAMLSPILPGQFGGSPGPVGSATGNSSISGRGAGTIDSTEAYRTTVLIRGKVLLPDGQPPPPETMVQMRCVGQADKETETDNKGNFSFQFAAVNPESRTGPRKFGITFGSNIDCQLQAFANGYFSEMAAVTGSDSMGRYDAGTIVLHNKKQGAGSTVSFNSLKAPKAAKKAFRKGLDQARRQQWSKAQSQFEKAVKLYPDYAAAWYNLGLVFEARKKTKLAREAYEKAAAADSEYLSPAVKIAAMDARAGHWDKVEERAKAVIAKAPRAFPDAYFYLAVAALELQHDAVAEKACREGMELNIQQRYPQIIHILGMALAAQGKLEDAEDQLVRYLGMTKNPQEKQVVENQLAEVRRVMKEHPLKK